MIRHIVMWKFRPGCEEQAEEFLSRLEALKDEIPVIRSMRIERSAVADGAFDAVLLSEFDTLKDVEAYKNDPRHVAVSALCKAIRTQRSSIDTLL